MDHKESPELGELRKNVDEIDIRLLDLLSERRVLELAWRVYAELISENDSLKQQSMLLRVRSMVHPIMADRVMKLVLELLKSGDGTGYVEASTVASNERS